MLRVTGRNRVKGYAQVGEVAEGIDRQFVEINGYPAQFAEFCARNGFQFSLKQYREEQQRCHCEEQNQEEPFDNCCGHVRGGLLG